MASVTEEATNHGVALIVGFVMALILQEVVDGQFTGILGTVAENITVLYVVLILALFANRMSGGAGGGRPNGRM